jgi:hypothetical protein
MIRAENIGNVLMIEPSADGARPRYAGVISQSSAATWHQITFGSRYHDCTTDNLEFVSHIAALQARMRDVARDVAGLMETKRDAD